MLREMAVLAAFLLALSGIAADIAIIQKTAGAQMAKAERIMERANETD